MFNFEFMLIHKDMTSKYIQILVVIAFSMLMKDIVSKKTIGAQAIQLSNKRKLNKVLVRVKEFSF